VVNWHFKKGQGSTNLTVNSDGTYLFSGNYKRAVPNKDFDLTLALKSSLGGVILFHYIGNVSNGGVQWSKQGKSAILKDDFKTFANGHDWSGAYHFELDPLARKELREEQVQECAGLAWAGALGWAGATKFCQQFNAAW